MHAKPYFFSNFLSVVTFLLASDENKFHMKTDNLHLLYCNPQIFSLR